MTKDEFGDRMKTYENAPLKNAYDGRLPLYMRLDGRSFSKFTKKLKLRKPRDLRMEMCLETAMEQTMNEFHLVFGFSQSDEISFYFPVLENELSQLPFAGKTQKLLSVIPAYFTSAFIREFIFQFGDEDSYASDILTQNIAFDGRLVEFPNKAEATNMLIWRWKDGHRNYVSDVAMTKFSSKELHGMSFSDRLEKIGGIDVTEIGSFIRPVAVELTNEIEETFTRNKLYVVNPQETFDKCSFEERMSFIYDAMVFVDKKGTNNVCRK